MARRATPSTSKRKTARAATPDLLTEQPTAASRRKGRKAELPEVERSPSPDLSTQGTGDEALAPEVENAAPTPPKAKRRQKGTVEKRTSNADSAPGATPDLLLPQSGANPVGETEASTTVGDSGIPGEEQSASTKVSDPGQDRGTEPSLDQPSPAAGSTASAADWDPATGAVTFDWPAIEQVAARQGPNQAMARLLLAARAEGASSRWPF